MNSIPNYMNDRQVASIFAMSQQWVRGQRFKRAHGLPHVLTIDAVHIGTSRRYLAADVAMLADIIASSGRADGAQK